MTSETRTTMQSTESTADDNESADDAASPANALKPLRLRFAAVADLPHAGTRRGFGDVSNPRNDGRFSRVADLPRKD